MRIIVDQDETLAQYVDKILERWNALKGTTYTRAHINMWRMEETLGEGSFEIITEWMNEPEFFESLKPIPGAIEGFVQLQKDGHDVVIATSLAGNIECGYDSKRRWVRKHLPDFDLRNFFAITRKELLTGDVLIDDASHYLEAWHRAGNQHSIVMDAPWNKDARNSIRVKNWKGVLRAVKSIMAARAIHR